MSVRLDTFFISGTGSSVEGAPFTTDVIFSFTGLALDWSDLGWGCGRVDSFRPRSQIPESFPSCLIFCILVFWSFTRRSLGPTKGSEHTIQMTETRKIIKGIHKECLSTWNFWNFIFSIYTRNLWFYSIFIKVMLPFVFFNLPFPEQLRLIKWIKEGKQNCICKP